MQDNSNSGLRAEFIKDTDADQQQQQQEQQEQGPRVRDVTSDGTLSFNGRDDSVQRGPAARASVNGSDMASGQGILATARTAWGGPARELTDDTIVTAHGMDMKLSSAVHAKLVQKNADGSYTDAPAQAAVSSAPTKSEQELTAERWAQAAEREGDISAMEPEPYVQEAENDIAAALEGADREAVSSLVSEAALRFGETGDLQGNLEQVVSRTGMSPEKAAVAAAVIETVLRSQAASELAKAGIDGDDFMQWALSNEPARFKQAVLNHATARSMNGYRALATQYLKSTTPTTEALTQAGFKTMQDPQSKELLVQIGGIWVSAKAAARSGRI